MNQDSQKPPVSELQVTELQASEPVSNRTDAKVGRSSTSGSQSAGSQSKAGHRGSPTANRMGPLLLKLALVFVGGLLALSVMAAERPLPGGVVWGTFGCLLATVGLLGAIATKPQGDPGSEAIAGRLLVKPFTLFGVSLLAHFASVVLAVAGVLPWHRALSGVLVTASFVALIIGAYRAIESLGLLASSADHKRSLWQRQGFWLLVLAGLLYLPMLGNFALLDPWETHYGEVAREMLARDDWISLWWAQDGWFFTKPILNFWLQGLSFKLFGVEFLPDRMLLSSLQGRVPSPEWAARLPIFWLTIAATYALYKAAAVTIGRRAAFVGGLVLLTSPHWLLLGRQTMADMPYVAPLAVAMALMLIAFQTDPDVRVALHTVRLGRFQLRFDAWHLLFGVVLMCVVPQVVYLLSRNVTLHLGDPFGFRPHVDEILRGSGGGNCGLPGNSSCRTTAPLHTWGQPLFGAALWLLVAVGLLLWNRKERRRQRLLFIGAWLATALSVMAKGAPGLVLPLVTALGYPIVTGRFRELLRMKLPALLLLTLCVALPWYVQMFMRHGMPFFERLVLHDMVNRAFAHVHDTNKGDDVSFRYYVWQLGYGLFPWTGLAAAGLFWWTRTENRPNSKRQSFVLFSIIWILAAFGMFSLTLTKFHHYILPLVPPAAMLSGLLVSAYVPKGLFSSPRRALLYLALLLLAAEALLFGTACFFPNWKLWLVTNNPESPPAPWLGATALLCGAVLLGIAVKSSPPRTTALRPGRARDVALSVVALVAAVAVALAGRDMFITRSGDIEGQIRLLHLITYNYARPWPDVLDLRGPLAAFTAVATFAVAGLAVLRFRRHAASLLLIVSLLWGAWCCDDYLVRIAPHWSQRENMLAYYRHRKDPSERLVAYQMNWKGENFYTGNNMATFVSSGTKFKRWLKKMRKRGTTTMFFTTEHSRARTLKKELGKVESFEELTTEADDNKFFVAKVVFPPYRNDEPEDADD